MVRTMLKSALLVLAVAALGAIWLSSGSSYAAGPFGAAMDFGTGCLLGGAQDKKFIEAEDAHAKINGGETYKVYSLKGKLGNATGSRPVSIGIPCEETMEITTRPTYAGQLIALSGNWAGMPRVPVAISPSNATYKAAVRDLLTARGLTNPNVMIDQAYRIDLEGDGVSEVIISATYFKNGFETGGPSPNGDAGDYSILFMRKVIHGRVQTVVMAENVYPEYAEFVAPSQFRIRGIVDINGDGKMEVLIYGFYYEGGFTGVYEINGTQFKEVMFCGCGV